MYSIELVIARYREDLNWLNNTPPGLKRTVYDKSGNALVSNAISLPNVGREAHTYLHHLISHYDSLADWTIFCQGRPFDHAYDFHHTLRDFAAQPDAIGSFRWLGHLIDTDDNQGYTLFRTWSKNEDGRTLDLRRFHQELFGTAGPPEYTFVLGAQFAVHRDLVRSRPLTFYEHALHLSQTFPDAAHCYERLWDRVFGVEGIDRPWLAGRKTVLLKKMKKQTV